jgi:amphi-Trp domain-containing protein
MSGHKLEKPDETTHVSEEKVKIVHDTNLEFQTALSSMHQIIETARDGNFTVEADGKSITLVPSGNVDFRIRAREKGRRQSISFDLNWMSDSDERAADNLVRQTQSGEESCFTQQIRLNCEAAEREYAQLESRIERELFGGCSCVEVPGPE